MSKNLARDVGKYGTGHPSSLKHSQAMGWPGIDLRTSVPPMIHDFMHDEKCHLSSSHAKHPTGSRYILKPRAQAYAWKPQESRVPSRKSSSMMEKTSSMMEKTSSMMEKTSAMMEKT